MTKGRRQRMEEGGGEVTCCYVSAREEMSRAVSKVGRKRVGLNIFTNERGVNRYGVDGQPRMM